MASAEHTNADEILKSLGSVYAELESYQDKGYVESIFHPGTEQERVTRLTFQTYFLRPNLFRFEWKDRFFDYSEEQHTIIWCDGKSAFEKYPEQKVKRIGMPFRCSNVTRDLGLIIAGATGVSKGAAHTVPALMMPDVGGRRIIDLKNVRYVDDGEVCGESCYRVENNDSNPRKNETIFWISKSRLIVRKISKDYVVGGSQSYVADFEAAPWWSPRRWFESLTEQLLFKQFGFKQCHMPVPPRRIVHSEEFSIKSATVYESVEINQGISKEIFKFVQ